jgi:hypothetical protein
LLSDSTALKLQHGRGLDARPVAPKRPGPSGFLHLLGTPMKRLYWKMLLLPLVVFGFIWCVLNDPTVADDQVAIIANTSNSVSTLSPGDLHRIFLGEKSTWPNGKHIFVVMAAPGSPERAVIMKNVYKMSESDYAKYFMQASFTGAVAAPPKDASSSSQMKQLVAANPGAVGYVAVQELDNSVKALLKVP